MAITTRQRLLENLTKKRIFNLQIDNGYLTQQFVDDIETEIRQLYRRANREPVTELSDASKRIVHEGVSIVLEDYDFSGTSYEWRVAKELILDALVEN